MSSRPIPALTAESKTYWEAAAAGQLLLGKCLHCAEVHHPPQAVCPRCWSETSTILSGGIGTVEAFSVVHKNATPAFRDIVPYVVAFVRLDEGPALTTNIVGCETTEVEIGMRVRVTFESLSDEVAIPLFSPM